jgi:putative transposase
MVGINVLRSLAMSLKQLLRRFWSRRQTFRRSGGCEHPRGGSGMRFVGDITYMHTWQWFIYLATVFDCYSKRVVGWSITEHTCTEQVEDASKNAAATTLVEPRAIWQAHCGSVHTSTDFRTLLTSRGRPPSIGQKGAC